MEVRYTTKTAGYFLTGKTSQLKPLVAYCSHDGLWGN